MFKQLFQNRLAYFGTSFVLFLAGMVAVSIGSTSGPPFLSGLGIAALGIAAAIPPLQRFLSRSV